MRALILALSLLFTGCATHTHMGDCASCSGYVMVQDQVSNALLKQEIFKAVGEALRAQQAPKASAAPITTKVDAK